MRGKGTPPLTATTAAAGAAGAAAAAYCWHRASAASQPPELHYTEDSELGRKVIAKCATLHAPYSPTPWAHNTHLQSSLGLLRRATIANKYTRQIILADDGGTLALDWYDGCDAPAAGPPETPILLILHGINGGSHEGYCKWACAAGRAAGWRAVVLNYRGCNGLPLTSSRGYAATLSSDVAIALRSVRGRFPAAPVAAAGYSLGSMLLTKYVAEADAGLFGGGGGSGLVAALMVSNPTCMEAFNANMAKPWSSNRLYNLALAHKLKEYLATHAATISTNSRIDLPGVLRKWTIDGIEAATLRHSLGYADPADYHRDASSQHYIPAIRTPSLFLMARDDPFVAYLPIEEIRANPHTALAVTSLGGHVGFLTGLWPFNASWMDAVLTDFVGNALRVWTAAEAAAAAAAAKVASVGSVGSAGGGNALGGTAGAAPGGEAAEGRPEPDFGGDQLHFALSKTFKSVTGAKPWAVAQPAAAAAQAAAGPPRSRL